MIDLVHLKISAGSGGHGRVSFRREKFAPRGGPDGGMGGVGGSVLIRAVAGMSTLKHLAGIKEIRAGNGQMGGKKRMFGLKGVSEVIEVPPGTEVWLEAENQPSKVRSQKFGVRHALEKADVRFEKYWVEKAGQPVPPRDEPELLPVDYPIRWQEDIIEPEATEQKLFGDISAARLVTLAEAGQEFLLCQGGWGGRGSESFKSSVNTTPLEAEYGTWGEQKLVFLELKLLADVGLVGYPNAGKSTLLSRLTQARPKIANYPFTTIEPNLGVITLAEKSGKRGRELVLADIPGLIEGAHEGKGLGYGFLRHIENCQALWYVLALDDSLVFDSSKSTSEMATKAWNQYQLLQEELKAYRPELLEKQAVVTLNKCDLYPEEVVEACRARFKKKGVVLLPLSGATGRGVADVSDILATFPLK